MVNSRELCEARFVCVTIESRSSFSSSVLKHFQVRETGLCDARFHVGPADKKCEQPVTVFGVAQYLLVLLAAFDA